MWWPWRRRSQGQRWSPPDPIPDGDTVLAPGQRRWADLLGHERGPQTECPHGNDREPMGNPGRVADMQAEAALRTALNEPTVILEGGVRVPAWLARELDDDA